MKCSLQEEFCNDARLVACPLNFLENISLLLPFSPTAQEAFTFFVVNSFLYIHCKVCQCRQIDSLCISISSCYCRHLKYFSFSMLAIDLYCYCVTLSDRMDNNFIKNMWVMSYNIKGNVQRTTCTRQEDNLICVKLFRTHFHVSKN